MRLTNYTIQIWGGETVLVKESGKNYTGNLLNTPEKIFHMMNELYSANLKAEEYMWMIALNNKSNPIGIFELSHGTVNASLVSPREIFVRLCLCGAVQFVLVHNHPSGEVEPSSEDIKTTERIIKAGELMNIPLVDHIIIGKSYYSFHEKKLINKL